MSTLSPDQWQALSPYLDQALAMSDEERAAWLASLGEQNPASGCAAAKGSSTNTACWPRRFSGEGLLSDCRARAGTGWPDHRRIYADLADRPGRHGQRVAGGAQRRAIRAASGGEVPEHRARRARAARNDSSARAAYSAALRMLTSRNWSMRVYRRPASPISYSNMSKATTLIATVTNTSSTWRRDSGCFSMC